MGTKVTKETTTKNRGSRRVKSETINVSSINVSAPVGVGLSDGVRGASSISAPVGVGSSSASSDRAKRMDERSKLENAIKFESFSAVLGVRDLSTKLSCFFSVPEWSEKEDTENKIRLTFPDWSDDMVNAAVNAAAKKAGLDLSAPAVSAGRVLAVIRRENLVKDFVSLVGMSFNNVRKHIKDHGLNDYAWRLSVGAVRSDSDMNDFLTVVPVVSGSSASAVIGALLSLGVFSDYKKRVSAAVASDRSDYYQYISLAVRLGKRLGFDLDRVSHDISYDFNTCSTSDNKQRAQLRKNLASAIEKINYYNDLILSLGGVGMLDSETVTSKVARGIKSALKARGVAYSVCDTIEKLLDD